MKRLVLSLFCLFSLSNSWAADIDAGLLVTQAAFRAMVEDLGATISYRAISPAEPLGVLGFDIGVEVTSTDFANISEWSDALGGDTMDTIYLPKIHIHKGLPLGFDIGAFFLSGGNSNVEVKGAEIRYAIMDGSSLSPALAIRGAFSSLSGVTDLDLETKTLELTISKGFTIFTPYAGIGKVYITGTPTGSISGTFTEEDFDVSKTFVGLNINLGILNIVVDADKIGDTKSQSIKLGWRF